MQNHQFRPESLMMSYGYKPELSEGAIKCPIFQTSTFVFKTAEEGKGFFEVAYGLREKRPNEEMGLIYSRINNPDLEILENRLCLWDQAEECAVFESGMSAITTVLLEFLKPGDLIVHSNPLYGGTDHFIHHFLSKMGIHAIGFRPGISSEELIKQIEDTGMADRLALIYIETPANPTNDLTDISGCAAVARYFSTAEKPVFTAVDNTYMGPLWQHPLQHGADLVIYSATKYIGGHSDVIAGAVLGNKTLMTRVKTLRTFLGNMAGPWTGWLLLRSLETLKVRMDQQTANAQQVALFLQNHPKIEKVYYPGLLQPGTPAHEIYARQCTAPGAMLSFDVAGGEENAFCFLNALRLIKLAVSLGSTESLAEHPATMTHAGIDPQHREEMGITGKMVRLSVGVEFAADIIFDLERALEKVNVGVEQMAK
ncbi:MAG: cystathionine gamma-synthase family protein [Bacteroidia bacterium]